MYSKDYEKLKSTKEKKFICFLNKTIILNAKNYMIENKKRSV